MTKNTNLTIYNNNIVFYRNSKYKAQQHKGQTVADIDNENNPQNASSERTQ